LALRPKPGQLGHYDREDRLAVTTEMSCGRHIATIPSIVVAVAPLSILTVGDRSRHRL